MEAKVLTVEERLGTGSAEARRVRKTGLIPAVMYSEGKATTQIALDNHEFFISTRGAKPTQLYKFKSENSVLDGTLVLIKDVQMEPVRGDVLHVDFLALHEGHRIAVSVGVDLVGQCAAVKENRVIISQIAYEIEVECQPSAIPSSLTIDITPLDEGESLHARDIVLPEGVRLKSLGSMTIVTALSKKELEASAAAAEAAMVQPAAAAATPAADAAKAASPAKGGAAPAKK